MGIQLVSLLFSAFIIWLLLEQSKEISKLRNDVLREVSDGLKREHELSVSKMSQEAMFKKHQEGMLVEDYNNHPLNNTGGLSLDEWEAKLEDERLAQFADKKQEVA